MTEPGSKSLRVICSVEMLYNDLTSFPERDTGHRYKVDGGGCHSLNLVGRARGDVRSIEFWISKQPLQYNSMLQLQKLCRFAVHRDSSSANLTWSAAVRNAPAAFAALASRTAPPVSLP